MDLQVKCPQCGATLTYAPGTLSLQCQYCDHTLVIEGAGQSAEAHREIDLEQYLQHLENESEQQEQHVVHCSGCGADTTLAANQQSARCPFCDTALIVDQQEIRRSIRPQGLLPFRLERKEAREAFGKWLKSLWFAPNKLKRQSTRHDRFEGMYLPFWTYDCRTVSHYQGARGDHYYVTVQSRDSNGNMVSRQEQRTRWHNVGGQVRHNFDDVLASGTRSLPQDKLDALEPWDLQALVDYRDEFLAGYRSEIYQIDVKEGYQQARRIMDNRIRQLIRSDIGGDEQRITAVQTRYSDRTFKHILLPVWVSAYRYGDKVYQILVNARTGEVQGERPWSWIKITLAVAAGITLAGVFWYYADTLQQ